MSIANHVSSVTTQVSGAVTIGSALSSKTAEYVTSSTPSPEMIAKATSVMTISEKLAIGSFIVMVLSLVWNVYSTRRRNKQDRELRERELALREREFEFKIQQAEKKPD